MYHRYLSSRPPAWCWLPAGLLAVGLAQAEPAPPAIAGEYRSALQHYQPYRDERVADWRAIHDQLGDSHAHPAPDAPSADGAAGGQHDDHPHHHHNHHPLPQERRP